MERYLVIITVTIFLAFRDFQPVVCYHLHDLKAFMTQGKIGRSGRQENRKQDPWTKSASSYKAQRQGYQPFPVIFDIQQRQKAGDLVREIVDRLRLLMSKPNLAALMNTLNCDDPTHGHTDSYLPVPHSRDFHEAALVLLLSLAGCQTQSEQKLQRAIATSGLDAVVELLKDMHTLTSSIPVFGNTSPPSAEPEVKSKVKVKEDRPPAESEKKTKLKVQRPRFLLMPNDDLV